MSARATKLFNYDLAVKMWTFKPGYLGACIIALAILGGIILGSLGNVSTHTESTTAYEYKTDITGLFDVTQDPQFIEFSPATNYTGYLNADNAQYSTNPTGIDYITGSTTSNYRIIKEPGTTTAGPSGTVNNSSSYPQPQFSDMYSYQSTRSIVYNWWHFYDFKYTNMYDWAVNTFGQLTNYSLIDVHFSDPDNNKDVGGVAHLSKSPYGVDTYIYDFYAISYDHFTIHPDSQMVDIFDVIQGNEQVIQTISIYDLYLCYGNVNYSYDINNNQYTGSTSWTTSYTSTVTTPNLYDYMIPANGVKINTDGGATVWDNDQNNTNYDNYAVNIVFGPNFNENAGTFDPIDLTAIGSTTLTLNRVGGGTDTLTVICNSQGGGFTGWKISLNGMSLGSIGVFPAIMLSIQKQPYYTDGWQIKVYPVTSFTDYQNIEIDETPIRQINATAQYDLDNITFTDSAGYGLANISWSIYSTVVFMETYNAVFHNASINLYDYWPNMSSYRFALKNIALYGSSIVINGTTYPVHDQKITVDGKDYTLKNCYFSYSLDGNASITFNDINKTVDLGPIVTKTLTFNGNWGFNMGLYEGVASTKEVYDWDIKMFGDSLNTCIFIALALLAVCALACVWLKVSLKLTDKLILGAGALILVLMLVV